MHFERHPKTTITLSTLQAEHLAADGIDSVRHPKTYLGLFARINIIAPEDELTVKLPVHVLEESLERLTNEADRLEAILHKDWPADQKDIFANPDTIALLRNLNDQVAQHLGSLAAGGPETRKA